MELTQAQCQLEPRLPVHRGKVSIRNIQILNAILYVAELGFKWLGLPKRFRDGTPSAKGNTLMCHQGVDVQCKCTLILCYSTRIRYFDDTRDCAIGGLSADRYFFTLSLCMPVPGRSHEWTAPCAAPSVPPSISLSEVVSAFCAAEPQLCEVFQCHSRRTCQGSFRHRVWRPSL